MCIVSMVIDAGKTIPEYQWEPNIWELYKKAITSLEEVDKKTGQPDCDPNKKDWMKEIEKKMETKPLPTTQNAGKIHVLKCQTEYFKDVDQKKKTFEVRKNDRDFQVGDYILLNEVEKSAGYFSGSFTEPYIKETGQRVLVLITYILPGGNFGVDKDYCILGITKVFV